MAFPFKGEDSYFVVISKTRHRRSYCCLSSMQSTRPEKANLFLNRYYQTKLVSEKWDVRVINIEFSRELVLFLLLVCEGKPMSQVLYTL